MLFCFLVDLNIPTTHILLLEHSIILTGGLFPSPRSSFLGVIGRLFFRKEYFPEFHDSASRRGAKLVFEIETGTNNRQRETLETDNGVEALSGYIGARSVVYLLEHYLLHSSYHSRFESRSAFMHGKPFVCVF